MLSVRKMVMTIASWEAFVVLSNPVPASRFPERIARPERHTVVG
jgi:hypothetical protein